MCANACSRYPRSQVEVNNHQVSYLEHFSEIRFALIVVVSREVAELHFFFTFTHMLQNSKYDGISNTAELMIYLDVNWVDHVC